MNFADPGVTEIALLVLGGVLLLALAAVAIWRFGTKSGRKKIATRKQPFVSSDAMAALGVGLKDIYKVDVVVNVLLPNKHAKLRYSFAPLVAAKGNDVFVITNVVNTGDRSATLARFGGKADVCYENAKGKPVSLVTWDIGVYKDLETYIRLYDERLAVHKIMPFVGDLMSGNGAPSFRLCRLEDVGDLINELATPANAESPDDKSLILHLSDSNMMKKRSAIPRKLIRKVVE